MFWRAIIFSSRIHRPWGHEPRWAYVTVCEYRSAAYLFAVRQSGSSWLQTPEAGPSSATCLPEFAAGSFAQFLIGRECPTSKIWKSLTGIREEHSCDLF